MNKTQLEITLSMLETYRKVLKQERDTYRELCMELLEDLKRILNIAAQGNATGTNRALAAEIAGSAITKAEKILGENNAT